MRTSRCHGDSASGWHGLMTSQPLIVTPDMPVAAVLAQIRDPEMPVTSAAQVFVCAPPMMTPTGRYLGSVGFQRLLRQPPAAEVGQRVEASVFVRPGRHLAGSFFVADFMKYVLHLGYSRLAES